MTSILQKARDEGYRLGHGTASQVCHDEAYDDGRRSVVVPSRLVWWLAGLLCGIGIGAAI